MRDPFSEIEPYDHGPEWWAMYAEVDVDEDPDDEDDDEDDDLDDEDDDE